MSRYLVILEVSQKQAYIFGSNELEDNIVNSAIIAKCLSPDYIKTCLQDKFDIDRNLVYSGGGHTVLEYSEMEYAREAVRLISLKIYKDYNGLEIFAKIMEYDSSKSPKDNLIQLSKELETKKSLRLSSFHHGTFGVEKIDSDARKPKKGLFLDRYGQVELGDRSKVKDEEYIDASKYYTPDGYSPAYRFGDMGGKKGVSNFIAVVHIDGNGMGKRVQELYDVLADKSWDDIKPKLKDFSDEIDRDFKESYISMVNDIKDSLENGRLKGKLDIKKEKSTNGIFPVRRIITAGDDICFVTEGRIGVECAKIFIEQLTKESRKNCVDNRGYSACAGVAIVHQKYPFYRAYELAEMLCSRAKKVGAILSEEDDGRSVSLIDWHIEFGEMKDSLEEIDAEYISDDGQPMSTRPYIIKAKQDIIDQNKERKYDSFIRNITALFDNEEDIGVGKIKELRSVIKKGKKETENYMKFYKLKDKISADNLFDAIELMDTFLLV